MKRVLASEYARYTCDCGGKNTGHGTSSVPSDHPDRTALVGETSRLKKYCGSTLKNSSTCTWADASCTATKIPRNQVTRTDLIRYGYILSYCQEQTKVKQTRPASLDCFQILHTDYEIDPHHLLSDKQFRFTLRCSGLVILIPNAQHTCTSSFHDHCTSDVDHP